MVPLSRKSFQCFRGVKRDEDSNVKKFNGEKGNGGMD